MLKYLGCHENIVTLYDVITMPYVMFGSFPNEQGEQNFTDIYIVTQLYDCDLDRIISSNQVRFPVNQ